MRWQPDPTFYPSPKMAMEAPAEKLAYVAMLNPTLRSGRDAMGVVDVDDGSKSYGKMVGRVDMPNAGDELHHFGWNACSLRWQPHYQAGVSSGRVPRQNVVCCPGVVH